eukprot:6492700-Amphidinium_carterae.7
MKGKFSCATCLFSRSCCSQGTVAGCHACKEIGFIPNTLGGFNDEKSIDLNVCSDPVADTCCSRLEKETKHVRIRN